MKKRLIVLVGPSQSGKTTLLKLLLSKHPEIKRLITCTSRPPRSDEINGIERHFLRKEDFKNKNKFLEMALVHGNYYGSRKKDLLDSFKTHNFVMMDIDIKGIAYFLKNKEEIPANIITVFISPPPEVLIKRIEFKNDINMKQRIKSMKKELKFVKEHNYFKYFLNTSKTREESLEELENIVFEKNIKMLEKLKIKPDFLKN